MSSHLQHEGEQGVGTIGARRVGRFMSVGPVGWPTPTRHRTHRPRRHKPTAHLRRNGLPAAWAVNASAVLPTMVAATGSRGAGPDIPEPWPPLDLVAHSFAVSGAAPPPPGELPSHLRRRHGVAAVRTGRGMLAGGLPPGWY